MCVCLCVRVCARRQLNETSYKGPAGEGPQRTLGLNQSINQRSSQSHPRSRRSRSQHCHRGQHTLRHEVPQAWGAESPNSSSENRGLGVNEQALVCLSNRELVDASRGRTFHCETANNRFFFNCFGLINLAIYPPSIITATVRLPSASTDFFNLSETRACSYSSAAKTCTASDLELFLSSTQCFKQTGSLKH